MNANRSGASESDPEWHKNDTLIDLHLRSFALFAVPFSSLILTAKACQNLD
jgi:hypothetical protein